MTPEEREAFIQDLANLNWKWYQDTEECIDYEAYLLDDDPYPYEDPLYRLSVSQVSGFLMTSEDNAFEECFTVSEVKRILGDAWIGTDRLREIAEPGYADFVAESKKMLNEMLAEMYSEDYG